MRASIEQTNIPPLPPTTRVGLWFLAFEAEPNDPYSCGYEGNIFATEAEALAAISDYAETCNVDADTLVVSQY
jgi:hypothetical protein